MRQGRRWCGWCMAAGILLFLWGASNAMAQTPGADNVAGAGWVQLLLGLVISLVGAYAKGLERRVTDVEKIASATRRDLDRDYYTKQEMTNLVGELRGSISAVHRRLDYLRVPAARMHQDDGS